MGVKSAVARKGTILSPLHCEAKLLAAVRFLDVSYCLSMICLNPVDFAGNIVQVLVHLNIARQLPWAPLT